MDGKSRVFRPEAEKIWHEDYQCEYYRGVIIDGEDNIVERCAKMHPNYTAAFSDAVEKMSVSPLYSRQTSPDMKKKLEEYKAKKALEKKRKTNVIFDPREWNEWKYIYDSCRGNGISIMNLWISQSKCKVAWDALLEYCVRKVNLCKVVCVMDYYDGLSEKEIHYIDEARIIGRTEGNSKRLSD